VLFNVYRKGVAMQNESFGRRTLVKYVIAIPVVGAVAKQWLFGSDNPFKNEKDPDYDKKFLAVSIIRMINTAQRHHLTTFGRYADISDLWQSEAAINFLDSPAAESARMGRSLYSSLRFDKPEIVSDWRFDFKPKPNGQGYTVALSSRSATDLGAFSSDERAVIYQGTHLAVSPSDWDRLPVAEIVAGAPLGSSNSKQTASGGRVASLFKGIAFGPTVAQAACQCNPFPCCCICNCSSDFVSGCTNCGCTNCVWCCCAMGC
jgi:hypothetical protein